MPNPPRARGARAPDGDAAAGNHLPHLPPRLLRSLSQGKGRHLRTATLQTGSRQQDSRRLYIARTLNCLRILSQPLAGGRRRVHLTQSQAGAVVASSGPAAPPENGRSSQPRGAGKALLMMNSIQLDTRTAGGPIWDQRLPARSGDEKRAVPRSPMTSFRRGSGRWYKQAVAGAGADIRRPLLSPGCRGDGHCCHVSWG